MAWIDQALIDQKSADAKANPRGREIHVFHSNDDQPLQRMLNAMEPGTYIRPHRHLSPPKDEAVLLLRGAAGVAGFDDQGNLQRDGTQMLTVGGPVFGVDLRAGTWHTLVAMEPGTVLYELKSGPYAPFDDKDFAPWAPAPDTDEAKRYLKKLESCF